MPPYVLPSQRAQDSDSGAKHINEQEYIESLVPTFLHVDYQGRVIRLETFSKVSCLSVCSYTRVIQYLQTLGPGNRLG